MSKLNGWPLRGLIKRVLQFVEGLFMAIFSRMCLNLSNFKGICEFYRAPKEILNLYINSLTLST